MKKLIKFVKNGTSDYNLVSKGINDSNHVVFVTNLINKGYASGQDIGKNKHMLRKIRRQLPRGKVQSKMYALGFRMK